ncbi:MAG: KH domain-containing protein [Sporomusaceae bacterium]|nr:KH domain-containing protein [Sporomusaceae bacterium]
MNDLVAVIAKALVKNPEQVNVTEVVDNDTITYELRVAPEDMGKIIGKQGRIAKALRTVVKAAASRENKKVMVEIIE